MPPCRGRCGYAVAGTMWPLVANHATQALGLAALALCVATRALCAWVRVNGGSVAKMAVAWWRRLKALPARCLVFFGKNCVATQYSIIAGAGVAGVGTVVVVALVALLGLAILVHLVFCPLRYCLGTG